jgi:hypothetical protein
MQGGHEINRLPLPASLELELGMSDTIHRSGWARNDTLRLIGILLPPCSASARDITEGRDTESNSCAGPADLGNASPESSQRREISLRRIIARFRNACDWLADTLEMPDVVTYLNTSREQRNPAHGVSLGLALAPLLLMRASIPTLAADFYDPRIFVVAMLTAPAASMWLLGIHVPGAILFSLAVGFCVAGLAIAQFWVCPWIAPVIAQLRCD